MQMFDDEISVNLTLAGSETNESEMSQRTAAFLLVVSGGVLKPAVYMNKGTNYKSVHKF